MIIEVPGNLLDAADSKYIEVVAHQTNTLGIMGGGVALAIRNRWPEVYEKYRDACKSEKTGLGRCFIVKSDDDRVIANLMAQDSVESGICNTNYKALRSALAEMVRHMKMIGFKTVAIPYQMGCGLGGGDWNIVLEILNDELRDVWCSMMRLEK